MEAVISALTSGITSIAADALLAIGAMIPVALPIMGAVTVVNIGIRTFKKVSK